MSDENTLRDVPHVEIRRTDVRQCLDVDVRAEGVTAAVKFLRGILDGQEQESFVILILDVRGRVTAWREVARGFANQVQIPTREMFRTALMLDATYIIVAHNHPSGDPTPSEADLATTSALVMAGQLIGCPIIEHIIIGDRERYYTILRGDQGTTARQVLAGKRQAPELD